MTRRPASPSGSEASDSDFDQDSDDSEIDRRRRRKAKKAKRKEKEDRRSGSGKKNDHDKKKKDGVEEVGLKGSHEETMDELDARWVFFVMGCECRRGLQNLGRSLRLTRTR